MWLFAERPLRTCAAAICKDDAWFMIFHTNTVFALKKQKRKPAKRLRFICSRQVARQFSAHLPNTKSQPNEVVAILKGRRTQRMWSFRVFAEAERSCVLLTWCRWRDLNPHVRRGQRILSPLRLPIPPHRRGVALLCYSAARQKSNLSLQYALEKRIMSGKRIIIMRKK